MKPMVSSITTIPNYPRGLCLHPALLSCIRAHFPLFTLKSDDKSVKRRKWAVCRKAARESSKATRGDSWTVVIEDIKGNTTITRVRGAKISRKTCKYPNRGEGAHLHLLGDILSPRMSGIAFKPMVSSITTTRNYPRGACLDSALLSCIHADIPFLHSHQMIRVYKHENGAFAGK